MDTLFSNITAVTMIDKLPVILGAYVGVTDGKISYISKEPPKEQAARVIDGRGMVLMPGLINCHAHLPMTPLRGYGDDHDLQDWLSNYIFPKEDLWDSRAIRAATLLGLAECLRFGTTSVSDIISPTISASAWRIRASRAISPVPSPYSTRTTASIPTPPRRRWWP